MTSAIQTLHENVNGRTLYPYLLRDSRWPLLFNLLRRRPIRENRYIILEVRGTNDLLCVYREVSSRNKVKYIIYKNSLGILLNDPEEVAAILFSFYL